MISRLIKKLYLSPELSQRLRFSWSLHFLFQFGWVISWVVVTALFVDTFGLEKLLYLFAIEAGILITSTTITHCFLRTIDTKKIINYSVAAILVLLIGSFWADKNEHIYILFGLALLAKDAFYPLLRMGLLRKTEELFTPTQAEKAIPITESALTVGIIAGAFFLLSVIRFAPDATTQTLFSLWMFPILLIVLLLAFEPRLLSELPELHESKQSYESKESTFRSAINLFRTTPFLRTIVIIVALQAAVFSIIEFQTISHLEHELKHPVSTTEISFSSENLRTSLFEDVGTFSKKIIHVTNKEIFVFSSKVIAHNTLLHDLSALNLFFGLIALFVQFVISPFLIRRHGIIRTILVYFIGLVMVLPIMLLGGSWPIALVRSYEHGFHSLFASGYHLSFYSTFSKQREFIRHLLEGIIAPLGVLLGVGILFGLHHFGSQIFVPLGIGILAMILVWVTYRMIPSYSRLAIMNLKKADSIREKMHAIEILGQNGHNTNLTTKELCNLLKSTESHHILREKIICTLQKLQSPHVIHEFLKILERENEHEEVKIKILEAMLHFESLKTFWKMKMFAQHRLIQILNELFDSTEHEHLKKLIVMNIFSHLPTTQVVPFFLKTMESADERIQAVCLRSCRIFDDPDIASYVEPYLNHANSRVRSHALIALWKFQDQESLREQLHHFFDNDDHESIVAGLYAIGELGDPSNTNLIERFSSHEDIEWRLHALVARAKLGDKKCFGPLMKMLFSEDDALAQKVFAMLKRVPSELREEFLSHMKHEIARQVWSIVGHHPEIEVIQQLSTQKRSYLHRLYLFANKHDDILILDQASANA